MVRAVRRYLAATKDIRAGRRHLFISFKTGFKGEISRNTVSGWIKKAIRHTHSAVPEDLLLLIQVKAHEVRAKAASWALCKGTSMEAIMAACTWKSASTFTSFYLQDMTVIRDNMYGLSVLAATSQC